MELSISLFNLSASLIAPGIPSAAGVSTRSAPKIFTSFLLSMENDSGNTIFSLYPFAAAANASATPVLPLVGSIIVVSLFIFPFFSAQGGAQPLPRLVARRLGQARSARQPRDGADARAGPRG